MARHYGFLLNDRQGDPRKATGKFKACCQANNSGTDDCNFYSGRDGVFNRIVTIVGLRVFAPDDRSIGRYMDLQEFFPPAYATSAGGST
jgi:hypothetical protein